MPGNIHIQFLGTGTIIPDPHRSCSAVLLELSREKILVDVGPGSLRQMAIHKISPLSIDYIFLTHFHPDHVGDLIPLLFALYNSRLPEKEDTLRVWGPRGLLRFLDAMEAGYGRWVKHLDEGIKFYELKRRLLDFPGFRLIWNKVLHKNESVGYRFETGGKVICFSGDSGYCQELIRLCRQADVAVLDCAHADEHAVEGHLSPSLAAKIAAEAEVRKLILTHLYPDAAHSDLLSVAQKYYSGPIVIARDGMKLDLETS